MLILLVGKELWIFHGWKWCCSFVVGNELIVKTCGLGGSIGTVNMFFVYECGGVIDNIIEH